MVGRRFRDPRRLIEDLTQRIEAGLAEGMTEVQQEIRILTPVFSGSLRASGNVSQGMPDLRIYPPRFDPSGEAIPDSVPLPPLFDEEIKLADGDIYWANNVEYAQSIYLNDGSRKLNSQQFEDFMNNETVVILERAVVDALLGF